MQLAQNRHNLINDCQLPFFITLLLTQDQPEKSQICSLIYHVGYPASSQPVASNANNLQSEHLKLSFPTLNTEPPPLPCLPLNLPKASDDDTDSLVLPSFTPQLVLIWGPSIISMLQSSTFNRLSVLKVPEKGNIVLVFQWV